jgi:hypothetical protein
MHTPRKFKQKRHGVYTDQTVPIFLRFEIGTYNPRYKTYWHVTLDRPDSDRYPNVARRGTHQVS